MGARSYPLNVMDGWEKTVSFRLLMAYTTVITRGHFSLITCQFTTQSRIAMFHSTQYCAKSGIDVCMVYLKTGQNRTTNLHVAGFRRTYFTWDILLESKRHCESSRALFTGEKSNTSAYIVILQCIFALNQER